jgi:hypothetical protein
LSLCFFGCDFLFFGGFGSFFFLLFFFGLFFSFLSCLTFGVSFLFGGFLFFSFFFGFLGLLQC